MICRPEKEDLEKALNEQLRFLQTLIDTIPNPIFYKDAQEFFLGCNRAFEERLGLKKEFIVGKTSHDLFSRDLAEEYQKMDNQLLANPGEQVHETTLRFADGDLHDVLITKGTFTDSEGRPAGLVGVTVDISDRKKAERALQTAHDELERRVRERTAELARANAELRLEIAERERAEKALLLSAERLKLFAYSVIHDLKSPTIGMHGFARLLHSKYRDLLDEKGRTYCRQIIKAAEHLSALVQTINEYIAAKEVPLTLEELNIAEILGGLRDEFSVRLSATGVEWVETAPMPSVRADRLSVIRIFTNLVDNALKYGGEQLSKIEIAHEDSKAFHIFSVADDGVGVSPENAEKLFRFFHRDQSSKGVPGAGLGLAIVKEIAERHGGKVAVASEPGKGTLFRIYLAKNL